MLQSNSALYSVKNIIGNSNDFIVKKVTAAISFLSINHAKKILQRDFLHMVLI